MIEHGRVLMTTMELRARMVANQMLGVEIYYYFFIVSNRMTDDGPKGTLVRFRNHIWDPKCITQMWIVDGETRVGLLLLEETGSEQTINYKVTCNTNRTTLFYSFFPSLRQMEKLRVSACVGR